MDANDLFEIFFVGEYVGDTLAHAAAGAKYDTDLAHGATFDLKF